MQISQCEVLKPFSLGFGSHTRCQTSKTHQTLAVGDIIKLDCESDAGNVWFYTKDNQRGKIECGSVSNMVKSGMIWPVV